jgi:DNA adenine methylase
MRSPIIWFGGKGIMVSKLLKIIPPHQIYVEVFGGGASLLFAKNPSPVEVYNDLDSGLVNFFRVLRDPDKFERFYKLVSLTPYSREEYLYCRDTWEVIEDDIERAYRWYIVVRMSFGGRFGSGWGYAITRSNRGMSCQCSKWLSIIDQLPQIHARIMRVQIENQDFRNLISAYDNENTCFYLDPPYIPATRKAGGYKYEMTIEDHKELVGILLNIKGMAILSGYYYPVYDSLSEAGWRRYDFKTACFAVGRTKATGILGEGAGLEKQPRVESIWISPNCNNEKTLNIFQKEDV